MVLLSCLQRCNSLALQARALQQLSSSIQPGLVRLPQRLSSHKRVLQTQCRSVPGLASVRPAEPRVQNAYTDDDAYEIWPQDQLPATELPPPTHTRVKTAEYVTSSVQISQCPKSTWPEFAVIGRSNVGKSSLINMLTGRKALALVSKTPGPHCCRLARLESTVYRLVLRFCKGLWCLICSYNCLGASVVTPDYPLS